MTSNAVSNLPSAVESVPAANERPGTAPRRKQHAVLLAVSAFVLAMCFVLKVVPDGRVAVRGFEPYPLPHTCSMRLLFDRGCPGCGMTRGFIHLANGRLQESLAVHPLAWLFFAGLLLQFPYRLIALRSDNPYPLGKRWPAVCGWTLLGLLLLTWCVRLFGAVAWN